MAITKILARKGRLDTGINYILNSEKTEEQVLAAHLNCDPGRNRQPPQRAQERPQKEHDSQANDQRQEGVPPKKDSRSGRDSLDTKTRSSTSRESERTMMSEKLSVMDRLQGFRDQLDRGKLSVPTKEKAKIRPKER